jgi:RNA polymerase sigma-70 factor (ECF subfamily)
MAPIAAQLLERAQPSLARDLAGVEDLSAMLDAIVAGGRAAHPDLVVRDEDWVAHLARHLQDGDAAKQLSELRAADVHLVLACMRGQPAAHAQLDLRLRAVKGQALTGIRLGVLPVDELLQAVLEKLLVGADGKGKLVSYSGRGPLDGWLRVTLARAALSSVRHRDPGVASEPDVLTNLAATDDPQLSALRARSAPVLERAIEEAVAALPEADRTLLRLSVVDGLSIDELAVIYRAHRATLARRLARVRNAIFEGARARAMSALGLGETEFGSLMGMMLSQLDVTARRILEPSKETKEV